LAFTEALQGERLEKDGRGRRKEQILLNDGYIVAYYCNIDLWQ
jgi:hypothetical protein